MGSSRSYDINGEWCNAKSHPNCIICGAFIPRRSTHADVYGGTERKSVDAWCARCFHELILCSYFVVTRLRRNGYSWGTDTELEDLLESGRIVMLVDVPIPGM